MTAAVHYPGIKGIQFMNNSVLFVHLNNDRTFLVPLNKFSQIQSLSAEERENFEIIDEKYLSFLSIDDVFSLEDLIGLQ